MILRRSMNSPAFLRNSQLSGCGDVIELYRKRAILFASGTQAATMVFRHKEFQKQLKSLGIDETQTRCARSVDELRCLNNSIKYSNDALHVALATVTNCKIIVSWNFKHIVHFKKIPLYNAVNILQGYEQIAIYSPLEVIRYEE